MPVSSFIPRPYHGSIAVDNACPARPTNDMIYLYRFMWKFMKQTYQCSRDSNKSRNPSITQHDAINDQTNDQTSPNIPPVPFAEAFRLWLRIGLTGFGDPAGQIAMMHRLLVDEKR